MIEFRFAVARRVEQKIIKHPKAVALRIVINTIYSAETFDNAVFIA